MDGDALRNATVIFSILALIIGNAYSFGKVKRRPEYMELQDSGQRLTLNTLLPAYLRNKGDLLRPGHLKFGKIATYHLLISLLGFFILPILIGTLFWLSGVK
jgi:3',5'-cyclic AMP phosphodiesterase CpdA